MIRSEFSRTQWPHIFRIFAFLALALGSIHLLAEEYTLRLDLTARFANLKESLQNAWDECIKPTTRSTARMK